MSFAIRSLMAEQYRRTSGDGKSFPSSIGNPLCFKRLESNQFQTEVDSTTSAIHFNNYLKGATRVIHTINDRGITLETQHLASLQKEVERQLFMLWYKAATDEEVAARRKDSKLMDSLFREYADDIKEIEKKDLVHVGAGFKPAPTTA